MIHENTSALQSASIDDLVYTAVFSSDAATKAEARKQIHLRARRRRRGAVVDLSALHDAIGRGEIERRPSPFPRINIRALTYDAARALFRAAMRHDVGAFIFEIARSEIGYTEQRPGEYAACVLAAAMRERIQRAGVHPGRSLPGQREEVGHAGRAGGGDESAGVAHRRSAGRRVLQHRHRHLDARRPRLPDARRTAARELRGHRASDEVHPRAASRRGSRSPSAARSARSASTTRSPTRSAPTWTACKRLLGGTTGISKISVQTGTSHGGVPLPDGSIAQAKIDFERPARDDATSAARSTASPAACSTAPRRCRSRSSTSSPKPRRWRSISPRGFQNMILDAPSFPQEMKDGIREFCFANCLDERKAGRDRRAVRLQDAQESARPVQAADVGDGRRREAADHPASSKTSSSS